MDKHRIYTTGEKTSRWYKISITSTKKKKNSESWKEHGFWRIQVYNL